MNVEEDEENVLRIEISKSMTQEDVLELSTLFTHVLFAAFQVKAVFVLMEWRNARPQGCLEHDLSQTLKLYEQ